MNDMSRNYSALFKEILERHASRTYCEISNDYLQRRIKAKNRPRARDVRALTLEEQGEFYSQVSKWNPDAEKRREAKKLNPISKSKNRSGYDAEYGVYYGDCGYTIREM